MKRSDRRSLEAMDDRELADIGLTRGDLPRLYAERHFWRFLSPRANLDAEQGNSARSIWRGDPSFSLAIFKASAAVSVMLITWAVVRNVVPGSGSC